MHWVYWVIVVLCSLFKTLFRSFFQDKSSLPLKHFQFLGWPEESGKVPEHGADVIDLIGQVQKWQRTAGTAPVVVHCR